MTLEQFVHNLEDRLRGLGSWLWREEAIAGLHERVDDLAAELQKASADLAEQRRTLEEARGRIQAGEIQAALLASQVETYLHVHDQEGAWRHALKLDEVRGRLERDRAEAAHLEQLVWNHRVRIKQREKALAALQAKLYAFSSGAC